MTDRRNVATFLLAGVTAVALYVCYLLFRPYITAILLACVIAIVFYPLHRRIQRMFGATSLSAGISTVLTLLLGVVPFGILLVAVSNELSSLYQSLAGKNGGGENIISSALQGTEKLLAWLGRHLPLPAIDLKKVLLSRLGEISGSLLALGAAIVKNIFSFLVTAVIALVALFFLYRDGESAVAKIMAALPYPQDRLEELRSRISSTVMANFYGGLVIGALQGTIAGIIFWALGLDSPVLWGVITACFALVPMFGTSLVWVPVGITLLLSGHITKGILLLALGAGVIGTVDNFVRPLIIRKAVHLHMLLVFFSLLGGLQLFGVPGIFVGPVILSVTAALLVMLKEDLASRQEPATPTEVEAKKSQSPGY
jgi:predicted PurR-regulated permease PerM